MVLLILNLGIFFSYSLTTASQGEQGDETYLYRHRVAYLKHPALLADKILKPAGVAKGLIIEFTTGVCFWMVNTNAKAY